MADYCTFLEIKQSMPDSTLATMAGTEHATAFSAMITSASRLIDREVGRWANYFYPSTDGETRYFDGSGSHVQEIDECLSITTLAVSESGEICSTGYTTWVDTEYYVVPYNYAALGQPFYKLRLDRLKGTKSVFYGYTKGIAITGIFGYSLTPPEDIKQACKIQVMRWYMRAKQAWQDAGASVELGQMIYVQQLDPDVKNILAPYQIGNLV